MTSLIEFLAEQRRQRRRGKLAGLTEQIQELRDLGASYREIAVYLSRVHGIEVSRTGLLQHVKRHSAQRSVQSQIEVSETLLTELPPEQTRTPIGGLQDTATQGESLPARRTISDNSPPIPGQTEEDDVVVRFRLSSAEHQEKLAALRERKAPRKT